MAARAIWKGNLHFGSVEVPVKLYSAVQDRGIHFRLLHEKDRSPVEQKMVNPVNDEVVPREEIQRGFALDDGSFVVLAEEELESLAPKPSREIRVERFVKPEQLGYQWYVRPYFLGPDGKQEEYFALAQALQEEGTHGISHWVMRQKEYVGALCPHAGFLMLVTLRHSQEVVSAKELPAPEGRKLTPKETKMAEQLVSAFEDKFDPSAFTDEFRERVLGFVKEKARKKHIKLPRLVKKPVERDLAEALAKSLKKAGKERKVA
jgi:DNA end-binding protein Ku